MDSSGEIGLGQEGSARTEIVREGGAALKSRRPKGFTDKMLRLLQRISEYDYLTIREVQMIYANQTHAYKVLNLLKEQGLVLDFRTSSKPRTAYCLSAKGYRLLANHDRLRVQKRFHPGDFKPYLFKHKTSCARVGLLLESHPFVRGFEPEKLLWERRRPTYRKVCDGEFWCKIPWQERNCRIGLEVELTLKNRGKLADSFRDLKAREDLEHVWWVCGDKVIYRALAREIRDRTWLAPQDHLLITLEEALRSRDGWILTDSKQNSYSIDPKGSSWPPDDPSPRPLTLPSPQRGEGEEVEGEREKEQWEEEVSLKSLLDRFLDWVFDVWWDIEDFFKSCLIALGKILAVLGVATFVGLGIWWVWRTEFLSRTGELRAKRSSTWQVRRLEDRYLGINDWGVYPNVLQSKGDTYRLEMKLHNYHPTYCELRRVLIYDAEGKPLAARKLRDIWIRSQHAYTADFTFKGPRSAEEFLIKFDVRGSGFGCGALGFPIRFE